MKEVRDIKLDLLFGNDNEIINLFNEITDGIEIVNTNVYNEKGLEFIYHKDGEWIFFQDVKNGKFWCSNARYWKLFTSKFDLSYEEIQNITKFLVEESLKREVNTTTLTQGCQDNAVEEALKRDMTTPIDYRPRGGISVEVALKKEIGTPKNAVYSKRKKVDDALKQELGTPIGNFFIEPNLVQEVLKKELSTPTYAYEIVNVDLEEALNNINNE